MRRTICALAILLFATVAVAHGAAAEPGRDGVRGIVAQAIGPLMQRYGVPGMAVGIAIGGHDYVDDFGVASRASGKPVDADSLFEIGSVTKTFTATLVSYAQVTHRLSLSDEASAYLPALRGTSFDRVSLLNLGTHTSGGLPLQFPDTVTNDDQAMSYYREWTPAHAPGTVRIYSNPSIMLLGLLAARSMHAEFSALMDGIFSKLGLKQTYLRLPLEEMANYAQGYTAANAPIRMAPGPLASEAYGVRTTAGDLLRFVDVNMGLIPGLDPMLMRAIVETHVGYYRAGPMTQDLMWEQYGYPARLSELLEGNSDRMLFEANPVVALQPPLRPRQDVLIDKTGSTNGFSTYVAFVPAKRIGVVLLANKSYPIAARVRAAYQILTSLAKS